MSVIECSGCLFLYIKRIEFGAVKKTLVNLKILEQPALLDVMEVVFEEVGRMFSKKEKLKGRQDVGPEAMKKKKIKVEPQEGKGQFGKQKM